MGESAGTDICRTNGCHGSAVWRTTAKHESKHDEQQSWHGWHAADDYAANATADADATDASTSSGSSPRASPAKSSGRGTTADVPATGHDHGATTLRSTTTESSRKLCQRNTSRRDRTATTSTMSIQRPAISTTSFPSSASSATEHEWDAGWYGNVNWDTKRIGVFFWTYGWVVFLIFFTDGWIRI